MLLDEMIERGLPEETRMMRDVTRRFVNEHVIPFTRQNWQQEWQMTPRAGCRKNPGGGRRDRHPHARRSRGVRRHPARSQDRGADRGHLGGDLARRLRPLRQDGADLEGLGVVATSRRATCRSSGSRAW